MTMTFTSKRQAKTEYFPTRNSPRPTALQKNRVTVRLSILVNNPTPTKIAMKTPNNIIALKPGRRLSCALVHLRVPNETAASVSQQHKQNKVVEDSIASPASRNVFRRDAGDSS